MVLKVALKIILGLEDLIVALLELLVVVFYQISRVLDLVVGTKLRFAFSPVLVIFHRWVAVSGIFEILGSVVVAS